MKIPVPIICVVLSALFGLQAFTLKNVFDLKADVAEMRGEIQAGAITKNPAPASQQNFAKAQ